MNLLPVILAETAPTCPSPGASSISPLVMMAIVFAIFYFMMIRPQRRRDKERKEMISDLKKGDRVLLTSGILGQIITVKDEAFLVRIAEGTQIEVIKSAISQIFEKGETPTEIESAK